MSKPRRTVLSGIVTPLVSEPPADAPAAVAPAAPAQASRRSVTKDATVQQTVYLPPAVHEQLRELAFTERAKMHTLLLEGLDDVFRSRGMKSIAELTGKI
jgi:hypothetical protein